MSRNSCAISWLATTAGLSDSPRWRSPFPGRFAGPIPHAHDEFDEAIYVLSGQLLVVGDGGPQEAVPGSMFVAPRGHRHGFVFSPDTAVSLRADLSGRQAPSGRVPKVSLSP